MRVSPGARSTRVGGRHPSAHPGPDALVVSVTARAVDGRANAAVERALAEALGVRPREVRLVGGHTSRIKTIEVPERCRDLVEGLLAFE
ncbi:MAG: DUF167 domain-containing protein [Propionibacterium sp.]|nr:DUF167 domain-containing protein [Propionibacterium sp.]